ncbi:toxin-antitoxin system YwqK family antitoxin [Melittangium boletus]|uniref:Phophatidylinositol-4-phosphate 5-kinase n=1 Tax=Melittangium boletus DSM 14713 TaxID=1294270 RepID=A0A250ICN7_9BACT|nr:hypothetical protein [Melittangium boletus]ATB28921.1 hypothetical protein MEBOL_002370 [Melittangium boletus DSM 14713]
MPTEYTTEDEQGRVRERCFLDDEGRLDGVATTYGEHGEVLQESTWRAGQLHGPTSLYDSTSRLIQRVRFQDGQLDGPAEFHDARERSSLEVAFHQGQPHGELIAREEGQVLVKQNLSRGQPDGPIELHEPGKPTRRRLFDKGRPVREPEPLQALPRVERSPMEPSHDWLQNWLDPKGS